MIDYILPKTELNISIKEEILKTYFKELSSLDIQKIEFKIKFKDKLYLKYLGLPKGLYRNYFIKLEYTYFKKIVPISTDEKDELKKKLFQLTN